MGGVCKVSCGSFYICCTKLFSALLCSTEHAHSSPLLLLLLLRMLPTPWAWCCNGHTQTHTHKSTHMSTCPQACKHTHTIMGQSGFLLSVLQPCPHSSAEHTVQRVSWHLGRYHSFPQPNHQLSVQEHTICWSWRQNGYLTPLKPAGLHVEIPQVLLPVLSFQGVLAALSLFQLSLNLHQFLSVGLLLHAQHLVFALQTHHRLPVKGTTMRRKEEEDVGRIKWTREWWRRNKVRWDDWGGGFYPTTPKPSVPCVTD